MSWLIEGIVWGLLHILPLIIGAILFFAGAGEYDNVILNILSVEQVINENNTKPNNYYDYLGTRWGNGFK